MAKSRYQKARELRATIAKMKTDLEYEQGRRRNAETKVQDFEERLKESHRLADARKEGLYNSEVRQNKMLFEIVRWLVNPESTKDPFNSMVRDEQDMKVGRAPKYRDGALDY